MESKPVLNVLSISKEGPSSNSWFHGRLDRSECEERLKNSSKRPNFLVRESHLRPGSYVLSYLSLDGMMNHYKITAVFGDYYIGGRRFDSLETLVTYYMFYSVIKQNEPLVNPIAPYETCKIERIFIATKSHQRALDSDELSFVRGDHLKVFHIIGEGDWLWAQLMHTQEYGIVNKDKIIDRDDIDPKKQHEYESWFYDNISKEQASIILANLGHCSYLVRPSEQSPGSYTLFFNTDGLLHRYRITQNPTCFQCAGNSSINFKSIADIIEYFKHELLINDCKLTSDHHQHIEFDQIEAYNNSTQTNPDANNNNFTLAASVDSQSTVGEELTRNRKTSNHNDVTNQNRNSSGPDILNRRSDSISMKGYLEKYNEKTKKWKPYWFVLNQTERQLYYFANEKRIKEKGLIDLCYSLYYPIDDSLFIRPLAFQIVINSLGNVCSTYYLSADNPLLFKEWTKKIRMLCDPIQINNQTNQIQLAPSLTSLPFTMPTTGKQKTVQAHYVDRSLIIEIKEAKNILNLVVNQSRTSTMTSNSSSNNTDFNLNNYMPLFKQKSSPLPQTKKINDQSVVQLSKYDLFSSKDYFNSHYYCLLVMNNDVYVGSTHSTTNKLNSQQYIWDERFAFDSLPLDVNNLKIILYANKHAIVSNTLYTHSIGSKQLSKSFSAASFKNTILSSTFNSHQTETKSGNNTNYRIYKSKTKDSVLVGEFNLELDNFLNKGQSDQWYKIDSVCELNNNTQNTTPTQEVSASMRVKIHFNENKILGFNDYKNLTKYLCGSVQNLCVLHEYYFILSNTIEQKSEFVELLFKFYLYYDLIDHSLLINIMKLYIDYDIKRCSNLNTLFRSTTLTTSLMDLYMKYKTETYLLKSIYEPLSKLIKQSNRYQKSFELDPTRLKHHIKLNNSIFNTSPVGLSSSSANDEISSTTNQTVQTQLEQNLLNFKQAFNQLLESICLNSVDYFPAELKSIFSYIRKSVCLKWTYDKYVRIYSISAFIFLRLICPTLINLTTNVKINNFLDNGNLGASGTAQVLKQQTNNKHSTSNYSLDAAILNQKNKTLKTNMNSINERNIKLLAKALQTLANLTECKEPFMLPLSEYLNNNRSLIIKFIDNISNIEKNNDAPHTMRMFGSDHKISHSDLSSSSYSDVITNPSIPILSSTSYRNSLSDKADDSYTDVDSTIRHKDLNLKLYTIFVNDNMKFNKNEFNEQNLCKILASMHRILCTILVNPKPCAHDKSHEDIKTDALNEDNHDFSDLIEILNDISSKLSKHV